MTSVFGYDAFIAGSMPAHLVASKGYALEVDIMPEVVEAAKKSESEVFSGFMVKFDGAKKRIVPHGWCLVNQKQFVLKAGEAKVLTSL